MAQWILIILISIIVGFVTTYLKINIDRIFLVLLLVMWMGFGIQQAILVNALVMLLASLVVFRQSRSQLATVPASVRWVVIPLSFAGGMLGRWIGLESSSRDLIIVLGIYAVIVGLRLLLVRPKMQPNGNIHNGVAIVTFPFSILTGVLSAGGKPIQMPILAKLFKLSLPQAYLVATLSTMASVVGLLASQLCFAKNIPLPDLSWSWMYFLGISVVMFVLEPLWNPKVQKWLSYIVGLLLILVAIRLFIG